MKRRRRLRVLGLLGGIAMLLSVAPASAAPVGADGPQGERAPTRAARAMRADGWRIEVVDESGDVGQYASLALDGDGVPHIAYYDTDENALKIAYQTTSLWGTSWVRRTVDRSSAVGQFASLALDPETDQPAIAYFDNKDHNLKLAWLSGSSWVSETVAATGDVGYNPSLAVRGGWAHVAYGNHSDGSLDYLKYNVAGPGWPPLPITVDQVGTWGHASLKLNDDDDPRLSYCDGDSLNYAWSADGTSWMTTTVDPGPNVGRFNALAMGPPVQISYLDDNFSDLKVAQRSILFTWLREVVDGAGGDAVGRYTSLAIGPDGQVGVSYYDATHQRLKFAEKHSGSTWRISVVDDSSNTGWHTSLAYDAGGRPHIAYYDREGERLMIARRDHTVLLPLVMRNG